MARYTGKKGYLYLGTLGVEVTTGTLTVDKWYKITAKASSGSALPATSVVGDIFYDKPAITLVAGDKVKMFTLVKLGFVTNVPNSASKEKVENTVQTDAAKSYDESSIPEITGSVEGYMTDDTDIATIMGRFFTTVADAGATKTYTDPVSSVTNPLHFFLSRNETTTVGEVEVYEYLPSIVDSLTIDKPMQGPQTFNFNYTAIGSERPCAYRRTVT